MLGNVQFSGSDNFFDIGAHSLLAVQAHREIREKLSVPKLSITDIFRFPTLSGLAGRVESLGAPKTQKRREPTPEKVVPVRPTAAMPPNSGNSRQDAMAKRRAMRARRREKQL